MAAIVLPWKGISPQVARDAFVAPNATLIGDLVIGARSSIWFNVVMRADVNYIRVGERTNIQDGTIVHVATNDGPTIIGSDVLIGHAAIIHGCMLEDGCFVGMASTVMDDAVVESGAMVAAGALVTPGKRVKSRQLWAGSPAKFMRELTDAEVAQMKVQTAICRLGRYLPGHDFTAKIAHCRPSRDCHLQTARNTLHMTELSKVTGMRFRVSLILLGCVAGLNICPVAAQSGCPHGVLDARYCDRDGDMIADAPTSAKELADPDTLIFSYTPIEDPAVYVTVWAPFIARLEKTTGKKVKFFQVQSNAAQFEAMRSGRLHVTSTNTGSVPVAVNCAGFVPFAMMSSPDTPFASHTEIIVLSQSKIRTVQDLRGRTIAFTSPTSNSGYKTPLYLLEKDFGLKEGVDYKSTFSGKHDNSILGVVNGDYEAAAVADVVLGPMAARKVFDPAQIRSIYRSGSFPTTGYGYAHNLAPALAAKIREAFLTYHIEADPNLSREFPGQTQFIPITYKKEWEVVRQVDAATGVKYDCK